MSFLKKIFGRSKAKPDELAEEVNTQDIKQDLKSEEIAANGQDKTIRVQADTLKFDALRAIRIGELVFAERALLKSLELFEDFSTRYYLAEALLAQGKTDQALSQLDNLAEQNPQHRPTLLHRARIYFEAERYQEALNDIETLNSSITTNTQEEAEPQGGEKEVEDDTERIAILHTRILRRLGRLEDAIAEIKQLIAKRKDSGAALLLLAELLSEAANYDEALNTLDAAAKLMPEEERIPLRRAAIAYQQDDFETSHDFCRKTIELDPFNVEARRLEATLLIEEKRISEAIRYLEEAIEEIGQSRPIMLMLISIYEKQGDTDKAAEIKVQLPPESEQDKTDASQQDQFGNLYQGGIF